MEIEIWPEFDRPATLVLLKGEIARDSGRAITLRIPASSGGPSAVAQSGTAGGSLFNLPYQRSDAKDAITLRIEPPDRFFHVEFYDKLDTGRNRREYRYAWPGDLAVERLRVRVQQPSGASDFNITPAFADSAPGGDTLIYWTRDMGAAPAGKAVPISIAYDKSDARTSKEMLGLNPSAPADAPSAAAPLSGPPPGAGASAAGFIDGTADWVPAVVFGLIGLAAAAFAFWRTRRRADPEAAGAGFCARCGNALRHGDRFCSKCGAPVRR